VTSDELFERCPYRWPERRYGYNKKAQDSNLKLSLLYEAVIDLPANGLLTANCINFAAGILLEDLGLGTGAK